MATLKQLKNLTKLDKAAREEKCPKKAKNLRAQVESKRAKLQKR